MDALVTHHVLIAKQKMTQTGRRESKESCIANICAGNPCIVDTNALCPVHKITNARRRVVKPADNNVLTAVALTTVQLPVNRAKKLVHGKLSSYVTYINTHHDPIGSARTTNALYRAVR